jgi:hypothetical protein
MSAGPTREASFVESDPHGLVPMRYSSPPPSPDNREPVALGVPRKSKRLNHARQACCPAESDTQVEASERREIPSSVKGSSPFARDPRRRRGRLRSGHSLPTGRLLGEAGVAGSDRVLPSHLNLTSQARNKTRPKARPKEGSRANYTPSSLRVTGSPALLFPRKSLLHRSVDAGGAAEPALAQQPACTGDNDGGARRLRPGGTGTRAGAVCELGLSVGSPSWGIKRTGPQVGAGSLFDLSRTGLVLHNPRDSP